MTAPNSTRITRLKAAGWVHIDGWLPPGQNITRVSAADALRAIEDYRDDAERIATTPGKRGRPKQGAGK